MRHLILAGLTVGFGFTALPLPARAQTLFVENFEAGTDAWLLTSAWKLENDYENCGSQLAPFPSGVRCLRMGSASGFDCHYHNAFPGLQIAQLSTPITLSGAGAKAWLRYANRIDTEGCLFNDGNPGGPPFDASKRELSIDGGSSWISLQHDCRGSSWHKGRADLSPYLGQQILLRFTFDAGDATANEGFGWLIDDVTVRIEPGSPVCDSSTACPCLNTPFVTWAEDPETVNIGGCLTSSGVQAELSGRGSASVSQGAVVLRADHLPHGSYALFMQGSALAAPRPLGDGLTCLAAPLLRLGVKAATSGAASYPDGANIPLSASAHAGETVAYQVHFRDAATFCTPSRSNFSNAYTIEWQP